MAYTTLALVRALGIAASDASDAVVNAAIAWADSYIDHYTGSHFEKITYTTAAPLKIDGSGTDVLELPIPVSPAASSLTKVTMDDVEQDLTAIVVYNRLMPDDMRWPRLQWKQAPAFTTWEKMICSQMIWTEGTQNILLEGDFGFLTLTETTPVEIGDVAAKIAIYKLSIDGVAAAGLIMALWTDSEIISESTRDRSVTYKGGGLGASSMRSQPTGYYIIDQILAMFRRIS